MSRKLSSAQRRALAMRDTWIPEVGNDRAEYWIFCEAVYAARGLIPNKYHKLNLQNLRRKRLAAEQFLAKRWKLPG